MSYPIIVLIGIIIVILLSWILRKSKKEYFNMGTYTKNSAQIMPVPIVENTKAYISIVRHGTRYPTQKVYNKLDANIQAEISPEDIGNLTACGYQEMMDYGRQLVAQYPQIFRRPERYLAFSTSVYRAKQSAQACLMGIGNKDDYHWGPQIDQILKINNFFIKEPANPYVVSCQFAKLLGLNTDGCFKENISLYEQQKDRNTVRSMIERRDKALPLFDILLDLIQLCIREKYPHGYLFFAHDSTLAPLLYLFGFIDINNYKNEDWLPFGARLEIIITNNREVLFFVNGQLKKTLAIPNN